MQRRSLIRVSLEIPFCSRLWHCPLRRTLSSIVINNVQSDAYCLCYEILFKKSKGKKDNHKSKFFEWDLQRRKSAAPWWKVQFVYTCSWREKENFQATWENVKLPLFERRKSDCLTTIWGWERDIKLSTDRREILSRMHNEVIVKSGKDHVVTPCRLPKLVHTK